MAIDRKMTAGRVHAGHFNTIMAIDHFKTVLAAVWLAMAPAALAAAGSGGVNAAQHHAAPYVVLISIDGFRWDYMDLYPTPALDRIATRGIRAERLIPVYPTLTFPNHYSIATGLYPAGHGIVGNTFPNTDRSAWYSLRDRQAVQDGGWYGGEPVWVAAERSGMVTAAYYFVGTEAPIQDVPMSHWHAFDASVPGEKRVDTVLEWLSLPAQSRPHLVTLYFEHVDTATHRHGPGSRESIASIQDVDRNIGRLLDGIEGLPISDRVYIVVVSDHGQRSKKFENIFVIDRHVSLHGVAVVDHGAVAFLYLESGDPARAGDMRDSINAAWQHGTAMLPGDTPQAWQVSGDRFADLIVQADPGYLVYSSAGKIGRRSLGDHGWAPEDPQMHGVFLASGPRLPDGEVIAPVRAVDVYPLMMEILGLPMAGRMDGDPLRLPALLSPQ